MNSSRRKDTKKLRINEEELRTGSYNGVAERVDLGERERRARHQKMGNRANNAVEMRSKAKKKILPYVAGTLVALGIVAAGVFVGGEKPEDLEKMQQPVRPFNEASKNPTIRPASPENQRGEELINQIDKVYDANKEDNTTTNSLYENQDFEPGEISGN